MKNVLIVLLAIVLIAGATGGDKGVRTVGDGLGHAVHWVSVAWDSVTGRTPAKTNT